MSVEKKFWNKKYEQGGISGKGSIGLYRNWKWNQIQIACGLNIDSLIDVGCGDLSFWNHPLAIKIRRRYGFKYTGIDISDNIIIRNRKAFPKINFIIAPAHVEQPGLRASVVLCMDLLFHIMDDAEYEMTIETLCQYTNGCLVIYTWRKNPFLVQNIVTDGISQYYRRLGDVKHIFGRNDMKLIRKADVPFDKFGTMYIFRRILY